MYQAVHTDRGKRITPVVKYLDRHDVVYKRPALAGCDGFPIGNGRFGGLLYHTAESLEFSVNHTDAWDFAQDGHMKAWAWEAEEKNTAPLSCGMVHIRSTMPVFDWMYLEKYEERLSLGGACVEGHAETPFSCLDWKVFAPKDPETLVFQVDAVWKEKAELEIILDRWASPNFFHHYEQVVRVFDKNLGDTHARVVDGRVVLSQEAGRCRIAAAACVTGGGGPEPELLHSHGARFRLPAAREHHFTLYVAAAVSEGEADPAEKALALTETAMRRRDLLEGHRKDWEAFWERSFIHIPGEDYLENLYYINLYQLGSSSLGKYPLTFAGLWGWNRDVRNWGHFYHWNHQQTYWCVDAAGHPELEENYLDYRFRMLSNAQRDGEELFGVKGAFYSDISNMNGYNAPEPDTLRNLTVGAQIALDFWRHYRFTEDSAFLKGKAAPVIISCASFLCGLLVQEDGVYVVKGGSCAYESYWNLSRTITDYAQIHALFKIVEELEGLVPLPEGLAEECREKGKKLFRPETELVEHEGETLEIYCAGTKWNGEKVRFGEGEYPYSPFPASLTAMVYPAGITGLGECGGHLFRLAENTARVLFDREVYRTGPVGCSGHTPAPQMAARLGMTGDLWKILHKFVQAYQIFPNGLMHFADISASQQWDQVNTPRVLSEGLTDTCWEEVHEKDRGERTQMPSHWFLHCYFEAASNLTAGINEALLQDNGGVLRVFPAIGKNDPALFTLWAAGGYEVTSEKNERRVQYIRIVSTLGGTCRLYNPWPGDQVYAEKGEENGEENGTLLPVGEVIELETERGGAYLVYPAEYPPQQYYRCGMGDAENREPKKLGRACIGLDKYY